ncbi:MAG: hypothetical protein R2787_00225 [Saprospiraceae bacterium]
MIAEDACDDDIQVTFTEVRQDGPCPDSYTLVRTWTATDNCDNAATHVQKVNVRDTTPPVLNLKPADITVDCDEVVNVPSVTATDTVS